MCIVFIHTSNQHWFSNERLFEFTQRQLDIHQIHHLGHCLKQQLSNVADKYYLSI